MPTMSQTLLPVIAQTLGGLDRVLDKLAAHCESKGIDTTVFVSARIFPDMFPFSRQIQIACDFAKGAVARLADVETPSFADTETSIADLKARIAKTRAFIAGVAPATIDGTEDKVITMKIRNQDFSWPGAVYVSNVVLPNFLFHAATAYNILRHGGVELGKSDFLNRG